MASAYLLIVLFYLVLMCGNSVANNVPVVYDVTMLDEAPCDSDPFQDEDLLATLSKLYKQIPPPELALLQTAAAATLRMMSHSYLLDAVHLQAAVRFFGVMHLQSLGIIWSILLMA